MKMHKGPQRLSSASKTVLSTELESLIKRMMDFVGRCGDKVFSMIIGFIEPSSVARMSTSFLVSSWSRSSQFSAEQNRREQI